MAKSFWRKEVIQPALNRDVDAAIAEQQSILANDPNNAHAYFALGTLHHFQGSTEQALQYFQKSIEFDSSNPAPHLSRKRYARYRCLWRCRRDFLPVITGRDTTTLA
jgi:tetratricopeptide (TPR) repeat protein